MRPMNRGNLCRAIERKRMTQGQPAILAETTGYVLR